MTDVCKDIIPRQSWATNNICHANFFTQNKQWKHTTGIQAKLGNKYISSASFSTTKQGKQSLLRCTINLNGGFFSLAVGLRLLCHSCRPCSGKAL